MSTASHRHLAVTAGRPGHVLITARPIQARCRTSDLGQGRHAPQDDHVPGEAAELLERHRWSSGSEERSAVRPHAAVRARRPAGPLEGGCTAGAALPLNSSAGSAA